MEDARDQVLQVVESLLATLKDPKAFIKLWKGNYFFDYAEPLDIFIYKPIDARFQSFLDVNRECKSVYEKLSPIIDFSNYDRFGFVSLWRKDYFREFKEEITKAIKEAKIAKPVQGNTIPEDLSERNIPEQEVSSNQEASGDELEGKLVDLSVYKIGEGSKRLERVGRNSSEA